MNLILSYVTGHGVARDILCKFLKIFYFFKCCSDLGRFLALQFGDYNIHNNIKLFEIFTTDLIFHGPIYSRKSSELLPCTHNPQTLSPSPSLNYPPRLPHPYNQSHP